ncbi:uncharacterized protein [Leptinotarsa decemlineata]|uniref:uncharacterized protein n=1 Tax=Leptinotarsa decemlineata TaxID=7539 RepID=UPI003D305C6B
MCYFCENDVQNFARHLRRNHSYEPEVLEIFTQKVKTKERRELLAILKKKGNFIKNSQECVRPVKQALRSDQPYLPCSNCLGFYRSKFLYRHRKICLKGESSRNSQAEGQNMLIKNYHKIDPRLKTEVFPSMRPDKISLEAKSDFLICAFGARYLKIHREKHFVNVTSRKMRELSRVLLEVKKIEPSVINLFGALRPKFYDKLVEATQSVSRYDSNKDTFVSPSYARNICTSLKQCCDIAIHMIVKIEPSVEAADMEANMKTMINLLQSHWRFDISNRAGNDINLKKFNKVTILPLAHDLKLLKDYLISTADESLRSLKIDNRNVAAYNTLLETVYCRTILLNRKRPGELQRMLLHTYELAQKNNESYEEFDEVVSETEKLLLKYMKRVVIRGKRGRGVPVILSTDVQRHISELLKLRPNFLGVENPFLFGKPGCSTPIYGYKVVAKYAVACGAKNPKSITCTRLRKHLATMSQLFSLSDNEYENLSNFMGHTPGIHKKCYRLPDDVYQTAKLSKLLILMERGEAREHKGKTLDEIQLDLEENLLKNENSDGNCEDDKEKNSDENIVEKMCVQINKNKENEKIKENERINVKRNSKGTKRVLIPWTNEQKEVVKAFFGNNIKKRKPPKRKECQELKELYPDLLNNKDWLKIKVFIQNLYSKK